MSIPIKHATRHLILKCWAGDGLLIERFYRKMYNPSRLHILIDFFPVKFVLALFSWTLACPHFMYQAL